MYCTSDAVNLAQMLSVYLVLRSPSILAEYVSRVLVYRTGGTAVRTDGRNSSSTDSMSSTHGRNSASTGSMNSTEPRVQTAVSYTHLTLPTTPYV